ncbi:FadR/GntR family transcriptional regulator [Salirhabdus sp. Marseille-P4669]|uniref:FadR/GntR family transcriptional regulator n=1 Tax=Salirhabdus sp. Marseille-P4669 TaxID=2042310 RepID=UPI000C7C6174|nr:GntR family transcriptional regulator [Salirhabdus sp. Marseille-P4669]
MLKDNLKVYQEVLGQIRLFIDQHNLSPGDRLPSERYLAETLKAGRSSVREALRAIELLGIIETRRGEGTFLKSYQPYHSVELLSSFILRESKAKNELIEVKMLLEQQGAKYILASLNSQYLKELSQIVEKKDNNDRHYYFFLKLFQATGNHLLLKIWELIEAFTSSNHEIEYGKETYQLLLKAMKNKDKHLIEDLVESLYKNCEKEDKL